MNLATLIGLVILLLAIALILVYFLRQAFDSSDTSRIDEMPEDDPYLNDRDQAHDRHL
ncbi:hypothetical protein [Bacillus badius]|uniref:hypothetical protein n=1 Tax=Bacillus badius TaxID=1455 RepID=UPI0005ADC5A9|nr:hypothetical protein [Bacillus badius]KIL72180.1 hypothetical protein SD78_0969 [Bacillus badius]